MKVVNITNNVGKNIANARAIYRDKFYVEVNATPVEMQEIENIDWFYLCEGEYCLPFATEQEWEAFKEVYHDLQD